MELKELLSKFFTLNFPIKRKYYFLIFLGSLNVSMLLNGLVHLITSVPNSTMILIAVLLIIVVGFANVVGRLFDITNNRKLSIGITMGAYIVGSIPVLCLLSIILYIALFFIPSGAINSESKK